MTDSDGKRVQSQSCFDIGSNCTWILHNLRHLQQSFPAAFCNTRPTGKPWSSSCIQAPTTNGSESSRREAQLHLTSRVRINSVSRGKAHPKRRAGCKRLSTRRKKKSECLLEKEFGIGVRFRHVGGMNRTQ